MPLIFLSDNGTAQGEKVFNAGMRGKKGMPYEGGHRVPCFVHWPAGGLNQRVSVDRLAAHLDLLPTLVDLCALRLPRPIASDGTSLKPLLANPRAPWPERTLVMGAPRNETGPNPPPPKYGQGCAVMTDRWRLVDGRELYDIRADPGQQLDLAAQYPNAVRDLRAAYEKWWNDISGRFGEFVPIVIGTSAENPTRLTCHDWHAPDESVPWDQRMIAKAHRGIGAHRRSQRRHRGSRNPPSWQVASTSTRRTR